MKKRLTKFTQVAGIMLALVFTFSCSGDDGDEGGGSGSCVGEKGNDIANYRTVQIGDQVWMAENLDYNVSGGKCYGEGAEVVIGMDDESRLIYATLSNAKIKANREKYGRLYSWATAMALPDSCVSKAYAECASQISEKHRGICPSGWHIPSNDEWETLTNFVGTKPGIKLKATSGWNDVMGKSCNGTDEFGFSALPGGAKDPITFTSVGYFGGWWSWGPARPNNTVYGVNIYYRTLNSYLSSDEMSPSDYLTLLFSVRCVKD